MNILRTLDTGARGILSHRLRSILTTLGILIGVAAVICTVGIGQASADSVNSRIASLGTNLLTITPGSTTSNGVRGASGSASDLTMDDVTGLRDKGNAPDIKAVAPVVTSSTTIVNGSTNTTTTVTGTSPEWLAASARSVRDGSFFTSADVADKAFKAVLGSTTASDLGVSVGSTVTIAGNQFAITGILATQGSQGFTNNDDLAVVPITTAQMLLTGTGPNAVSRILLSATGADTIGSAYYEAEQLLLQTHHITDSSAATFSIQSQSSFLSTAQSVTKTLTILLASIAAISLLVGGIGVMNIMLVSVTERTSEIGLRKALGATPGDILRQFLVEASTLSFFGGVFGVGAALLVGWALPRFANIAVAITPTPAAVAVGVAAAVGLVFGVYPALRAAQLAPIEALRSQ